MNAKEELTKLLMESYDRGVADAKQEALVALEKTVAVMVAAERETCAEICRQQSNLQLDERVMRGIDVCKELILARGNT
jgi:cobalamin biosynthesis Mg chelatase CobN